MNKSKSQELTEKLKKQSVLRREQLEIWKKKRAELKARQLDDLQKKKNVILNKVKEKHENKKILFRSEGVKKHELSTRLINLNKYNNHNKSLINNKIIKLNVKNSCSINNANKNSINKSNARLNTNFDISKKAIKILNINVAEDNSKEEKHQGNLRKSISSKFRNSLPIKRFSISTKHFNKSKTLNDNSNRLVELLHVKPSTNITRTLNKQVLNGLTMHSKSNRIGELSYVKPSANIKRPPTKPIVNNQSMYSQSIKDNYHRKTNNFSSFNKVKINLKPENSSQSSTLGTNINPLKRVPNCLSSKNILSNNSIQQKQQNSNSLAQNKTSFISTNIKVNAAISKKNIFNYKKVKLNKIPEEKDKIDVRRPTLKSIENTKVINVDTNVEKNSNFYFNKIILASPKNLENAFMREKLEKWIDTHEKTPAKMKRHSVCFNLSMHEKLFQKTKKNSLVPQTERKVNDKIYKTKINKDDKINKTERIEDDKIDKIDSFQKDKKDNRGVKLNKEVQSSNVFQSSQVVFSCKLIPDHNDLLNMNKEFTNSKKEIINSIETSAISNKKHMATPTPEKTSTKYVNTPGNGIKYLVTPVRRSTRKRNSSFCNHDIILSSMKELPEETLKMSIFRKNNRLRFSPDMDTPTEEREKNDVIWIEVMEAGKLPTSMKKSIGRKSVIKRKSEYLELEKISELKMGRLNYEFEGI